MRGGRHFMVFRLNRRSCSNGLSQVPPRRHSCRPKLRLRSRNRRQWRGSPAKARAEAKRVNDELTRCPKGKSFAVDCALDDVSNLCVAFAKVHPSYRRRDVTAQSQWLKPPLCPRTLHPMAVRTTVQYLR